MKLKRTVTVEFECLKITTSRRRQEFLFCPVCRAESVFISVTEAKRLLNVLRMQETFLKPEDLHFYQPDASDALVCLNSIINYGNNP